MSGMCQELTGLRNENTDACPALITSQLETDKNADKSYVSRLKKKNED